MSKYWEDFSDNSSSPFARNVSADICLDFFFLLYLNFVLYSNKHVHKNNIDKKNVHYFNILK